MNKVSEELASSINNIKALKIKVLKRTGDKVDYDVNKIYNAIYKANGNENIKPKDKISLEDIDKATKLIDTHIRCYQISKLKGILPPIKSYTDNISDLNEPFVLIYIEDIRDLVIKILYRLKYYSLANILNIEKNTNHKE